MNGHASECPVIHGKACSCGGMERNRRERWQRKNKKRAELLRSDRLRAGCPKGHGALTIYKGNQLRCATCDRMNGALGPAKIRAREGAS